MRYYCTLLYLLICCYACTLENPPPKVFQPNTPLLDLPMVYVEGDTMSSYTYLINRKADTAFWDMPYHTELNDFYIGKYEITVAQWRAVMGEYSWHGYLNRVHPDFTLPKDSSMLNYPALVTWESAQIFIQRLNRITGKRYRMPTELEWEYVAQGGHKNIDGKFIQSDTSINKGLHTIGQQCFNELGIYDIAFNASEWCSDTFIEITDSAFLERSPLIDRCIPITMANQKQIEQHLQILTFYHPRMRYSDMKFQMYRSTLNQDTPYSYNLYSVLDYKYTPDYYFQDAKKYPYRFFDGYKYVGLRLAYDVE